ncbi:PH domain-containing protein, partial [Paenibacillus sepulcri]|nr:PH domain-containing protein [Paenibacillus sepulcri]
SSISAAEARRIQESLGFAAAPPLVHPDSVPDRKETDLNIPAAAGTASVHDPSGDQKMIFSFQRLLVHSATSGMIGYVFIILIILLFKYGEDIMKSLKLWESFPDWLDSGWITVSLSLGLLIVVSWLLAVTVTFLRDYGFQLELSNDKLTIERGLLERKHLTIPLDRIQAVHLVRHWLHRPFGWVSIRAVVAGKTEKQEKSILIFPIVRSGEAADVLNRFIPSFTLPEAWRGLQPRAWRYFVFTPVLCCLIAAVPAIIWIPGSLGWLTLLLPAVILLTEQMAYRQMGWSAANGQIAVRYGGFSLHQALIPKRRIQWVQMSQTPFQEQRKLANLKIALAAGRGAAKFTLRCASESDIRQLADWISISRKDSKK